MSSGDSASVSAWLSFAAAVSSADTAASIIAFNAWASLSANDRTTALSPSLDNTSSQNHIETLSAFLQCNPPPPPDIVGSALMFVGNFLYEDNRVSLPLTKTLVDFCLRLCRTAVLDGSGTMPFEIVEAMRVLACIMYERADVEDQTSCTVVSSVLPFVSVGFGMEVLRHACDCIGNIISKKGEAVQQHIALAAASVVAVFEHLSVCSNVSADRVFQSSIRTLSILVGEASSLVSRRKHDAHPSNAIGGEALIAIMVKTVCRLLCSSAPSASLLSTASSALQAAPAAAVTQKSRRNRHSRVRGMSESEVSDAGCGSSGGGPVDAATAIDGKSRLHLLTCLLHLVRLSPRSIQPYWLQLIGDGRPRSASDPTPANGLLRFVVADPSTRIRSTCCYVLAAMFEKCKLFLASAESESHAKSKVAFTPLSVSLATSILRTLHTLRQALPIEENSMVFSSLIKCLVSVAEHCPFQKIDIGSLLPVALTLISCMHKHEEALPLSIYCVCSICRILMSCTPRDTMRAHTAISSTVPVLKRMLESAASDRATDGGCGVDTMRAISHISKCAPSLLPLLLPSFIDVLLSLPARSAPLQIAIMRCAEDICSAVFGCSAWKADDEDEDASAVALSTVVPLVTTASDEHHSASAEIQSLRWLREVVPLLTANVGDEANTALILSVIAVLGFLPAAVQQPQFQPIRDTIWTLLAAKTKHHIPAIRANAVKSIGSSFSGVLVVSRDVLKCVLSAAEDGNVVVRQRAAWSLSNIISALCEHDAQELEAPAFALQDLAVATCAAVRKCLNDNDKVRSSGIRCAGMLGQLAQRACLPGSPVTLWKSAWSDIQPSVCTCLLSFLEVADFAPKVKWNTCTAVQRLLQWNAWDEHTIMHLGSVLCSTVANDPHLKVVKSACLAAKFVPAAAIVPSGVKDVASRCRTDFFSPLSPGHSRSVTVNGVAYEDDLKALFMLLACNLDSEALQQIHGDPHAIALVHAARNLSHANQ